MPHSALVLHRRSCCLLINHKKKSWNDPALEGTAKLLQFQAPVALFCSTLSTSMCGLYEFIAICKPIFSDSIVLKTIIIIIKFLLKYAKTRRCQIFFPVQSVRAAGRAEATQIAQAAAELWNSSSALSHGIYRADKDYTEQIKIPLIAALSDRHRTELLLIGASGTPTPLWGAQRTLMPCSKPACCLCRGPRWGFCSKFCSKLQEQLGEVGIKLT